MDPKIAKKTQDTLGKIIKKPPLTDKLLGKPPFRFLHDIMTSVIKTTGFMQGLFSDTEMNSENVKDKDAKIIFLQKAIDMVCMVTGKDVSAKPVKIVAGHEPERTNEFLQALADAINKNVDNDEYVKRVVKGGRGVGSSKEEKKEDKKEKDKLKSEDKKKGRDSEEKIGQDEKKQSMDRGDQGGERKRERDREKDRHKEKDKRQDRDQEKDRQGERKHDRDGEKHKDRERDSKPRDKSREVRGHDREGDRDREKHKDRERESKTRDKSREERHRDKDTEKSKKSTTSEKERQTGTQISAAKGAKLSQQHSEVSLRSKRESQRSQRVSDVQIPRRHQPPSQVTDASEAGVRHSSGNLTRNMNGNTQNEFPATECDAFSFSDKSLARECCDVVALEVEASSTSVVASRDLLNPGSKRKIARHSSHLSCAGIDPDQTMPADIQDRESLATGDHWNVTSDRDQSRDKENESPSREKMNGDMEEKHEPPTRLQRPASAKGTRRRREVPSYAECGQLNGDDQNGLNEDDEEVSNQREPMLGEGDLPPQIVAARQLARPSSARPAPPRPKQDTIESEPAMRLGTGTNVIADNDDADDDDDNFLVQETVPPPPDLDITPLKPLEDHDTTHGALVQKMLESKKEVERGNQGPGKKTEIERPLISDAQRRKQRESVQKEVDKLRGSIQSLTRSANPLGKVMDYVQEDMDSMQQELDKWKTENAQHALDLKRETNVTDRAIDPLRQQLAELDRAIGDQLDRIAATKSNIIRNDQKIQKMLRGISSS